MEINLLREINLVWKSIEREIILINFILTLIIGSQVLFVISFFISLLPDFLSLCMSLVVLTMNVGGNEILI